MKTEFIFGTVLALSLASCSRETAVAPAGGETEARFVAAIDNSPTRASGESWETGDRIGVSTLPGTKTVYGNIPYKWDGSKFNADGAVIYFQSPEPVEFRAYYPYDADGGILTAVTDAAAQKDLSAIDFLYASGASADKTSPVVRFTGDKSFRHRMSRIVLTFEEGDGMKFTGKLEAYTLVGLVLKGEFNTETGIAGTQTGETPADLSIALENVSVTAGKCSAAPVILFPQDVTGGKIALKVRVEGAEYSTGLVLPDADGDGVKDTALKPGYNYTFTIRVKKTAIEIASAEISPWDEVAGDAGDAVLQ